MLCNKSYHLIVPFQIFHIFGELGFQKTECGNINLFLHSESEEGQVSAGRDLGERGVRGRRESEERRTQLGVGVTGHSGEGKGSERTLGGGKEEERRAPGEGDYKGRK